MWNLFSSKTKKRHIISFETKLAEILTYDLPKVKEALSLSHVIGISFTSNPDGIYITRSYTTYNHQQINRAYNQHFSLSGIAVYNNKSNNYQSLNLFFQSNSLTKITIDNPAYFHKDFDLNRIQKGELVSEPVIIVNPDQKTAEKALRSLSTEQLALLDLDGTFEIELDGILYYTILDMEDGNYVAVSKRGGIFWLNHDSDDRAKLLAKNPTDFFLVYKGDKDDLQSVLDN